MDLVVREGPEGWGPFFRKTRTTGGDCYSVGLGRDESDWIGTSRTGSGRVGPDRAVSDRFGLCREPGRIGSSPVG